MKPETLQKLVDEAVKDPSGDFQTVLYKLESEVPIKHTKKHHEQYQVHKHDVFNKGKRPDKALKEDTNNPDRITGFEKVNRIGVPMQKLIAQTAAAFLCANPIKYDSSPKEGSTEQTMLDCVNRVAQNNKLDFRNMELAERMASETECAELWYTEPIEAEDDFWQGLPIKTSYRLRMLIISPEKGDTLYPIFSPTGDMIAFGRAYSIKDGGSREWHVELYTAEEIFKAVKTGDGLGWQVTAEPNIIGKIPVIYYSQHDVEWSEVQSQIERLETQLSNHAETNDYFAAPMLFVKGQLISISRKADNGKILEGTSESDAKVISWDNAPESTKLEIDNLLRFIYACTSTPDISFDNLKGIAAPSGTAMEFMFMSAHLKAARKAGNFGQSKQRSINYQKAAIAKLDVSLKAAASLHITPTFEFFTIKDLDALTNRLTTAVQGGIMSTPTAVKQLGAVEDTDEEIKTIDAEAAAKMSVPALLQ